MSCTFAPRFKFKMAWIVYSVCLSKRYVHNKLQWPIDIIIYREILELTLSMKLENGTYVTVFYMDRLKDNTFDLLVAICVYFSCYFNMISYWSVSMWGTTNDPMVTIYKPLMMLVYFYMTCHGWIKI